MGCGEKDKRLDIFGWRTSSIAAICIPNINSILITMKLNFYKRSNSSLSDSFHRKQLEAKQFIEIVSYLLLTIHISFRGASIKILMIRPKGQFPKKMIALTYFKTIFITNYKDRKCNWNTLITYMTNRGILHRHCYTRVNLWAGFEPVFQEY